jgi:uncharacterized membrane protein
MADNSSSQPETRGERNKVVIFILVLVAAIILGYIFYTSGSLGVMAVLKKWIIYLIIAAVLFLIVFAVMKFLQKPKIDLVENDRKDIIDAAILSKPPMVRDLYATGDKKHGEFRLGRIIGYCQLQSYKQLDVLANLTRDQVEAMAMKGDIPSQYIIKEDCFVFKKFPFPFSLFEDAKVLKVLEDEHSQIIGDVYIYAVSVVKKYGMYFPNRAHLDIARIDVAVIREAWRGGVHQFLKDQVSINQRASGLDSDFKKDMDKRKLLKVPSQLGEEDSRR